MVRRNEEPLRVQLPQIAQTIFWYDNDEQGLMLTVGEWQVYPPPPTWREFFISEGIPHQTEHQAQLIWTRHEIGPESYDEPVDELWWETRFDLETSPTVKAHRLLQELDLGPILKESTGQPHFVFREWVDARDHLSPVLVAGAADRPEAPINIAPSS